MIKRLEDFRLMCKEPAEKLIEKLLTLQCACFLFCLQSSVIGLIGILNFVLIFTLCWIFE